MEVEAKFAITGALHPSRVRALDLQPYRLGVERVQEHVDTLLDTADRRVSDAHCALRVRAFGESLILTFKGPSTVERGVHAREEFEAPLDQPLTLDPHAWPEPIRSRVQEMTHGEPLAPLLRVAVERRIWEVFRESRVIGELALDTGVFLAGGRRQPLRELELELKGVGVRADLNALSDRLLASLPLAPESRSKLNRGLALLRHSEWTLDGYTPLNALVRHYLRQKTHALRRGAHHVRAEGDADAIHDMRVAIRRLRSTLMNMESMVIYKSRPSRNLRKRLGGVARTLGVVRDLDISLGLVADFAANANGATEPDAAFARVVASLKRRRDAAYEDVCAQMERPKFTRLLHALEKRTAAGAGERNDAPCLLTREWAGGALLSRFEALEIPHEAFDVGDTAGMHQARIAAKRLRYTIEMLAPALGRSIVPLRDALLRFQDAIGASLDCKNTRLAITESNMHAQDSPAVRDLIHQLHEQSEQKRRAARDAWLALTAGRQRRALAKLAGDL